MGVFRSGAATSIGLLADVAGLDEWDPADSTGDAALASWGAFKVYVSLGVAQLRSQSAALSPRPEFAVARHMPRRNIIKSIVYKLLYDPYRYI